LLIVGGEKKTITTVSSPPSKTREAWSHKLAPSNVKKKSAGQRESGGKDNEGEKVKKKAKGKRVGEGEK